MADTGGTGPPSEGANAENGRELALLCACLRLERTEQGDAALREALACPVDWTRFARVLTEHELAVPIAQALLNIGPDLLPDDIHYAFQAIANDADATPESDASSLPPEDELLALATKSADELRWNLRWPYEVAKFIHSHPLLDWHVAAKRARAQGCLRILILAVLLAHECFGAPLPVIVAKMRREASILAPIIRRLMLHWRSDEEIGGRFRLSFQERMRLHDRFTQRLSYGFKALGESEASPLFALRRMLPEPKSLRAGLETSALGVVLLPRSPQEISQIKRYRSARKDARQMLARDPDNAAAWRNLGHALFGLGRYRQALAAYDKAIIFEPQHPTVWTNRSAALQAVGADEETYIRSARPKGADAWLIQAGYFWHEQRFAEAIDACDRALGLDPENVPAARLGIHCRLYACDWRRRDEDKRAVSAGLNAGDFIIRTLDHRALSDSEEENRLAVRLTTQEFGNVGKPLWHGERYGHDRIRVAYLSTDFRMHAVATLIVGCLEQHDRSRFETIAISLQPGDGSALRTRMEGAFDRFVHAQNMSDAAIAQLMRKLEIDIAVDLNGYTGRIRTGILARRPAPVQVSYLGFAGTMDAPFIDYILADRVVLPEANKAHYSERVAYLPHCYMPNDSRRKIAEGTPTRVQAGLPQTGFVFACLSYAHKISPEIFDVWMRLLQSLEGSVLWLRSANPAAVNNLRHEAGIRGVSPDRLIFAPPVPGEADYLARLRAADLFLDTLPYNAHATASDALWAGLPIVTCAGRSFHARVAASLLYAAGLPELVTSSLAQYEELARRLATDPASLAALKARLMRNRDTCALFDTARMTRDLEAAYRIMWERSERGEPPVSFAVPDGLPVAAKAAS